MNTGFFDVATSCAAALSAQVAWFDPSLLDGAWRVAPAIWGTVAIEVSLPVLLAIARTRVPGLLLGISFHAILALAGNVPFSALALALYVAFLPTDVPSRLRAVAADRPVLGHWADLARRAAASRIAFPAAVGLWLAAAIVVSLAPAAGSALIANGTRLAVVLVALGATALLLLCRAQRRPWVYPNRSLRLGHPVFAVGIALLVANSISPYLGLKTESSFTMFSNLGTEAGYWNHLLIPEAVRVFGYQDELVLVTGSNDRALARRSRDGGRLVRFELERYLRSHPNVGASYATATGDRQAARRGSTATPFLDRVAKFRDVRSPERRGC